MGYRVLIMHPQMYINGGAELVVIKFIQHLLSKKKYDVALMTSYLSDDIAKEIKGIDVISAKIAVDLQSNFSIFGQYADQLMPKADAIIAFNHPFELLINKSGYNATWYCNEPPEEVLDGNPLNLAQRKIVNENIPKVCVATERDKKRFISHYSYPIPEVIPYGIDYDYWRTGNPVEAQNILPIKDDDYVILHTGWYHPRKNQYYTLEMIRRNAKFYRDNKVKFVFSGMPISTVFESLMAKITFDGINDLVLFDAMMNRDRLRHLYARSDLVIFPYFEQGGFLSIFEAISAGCKVVVSDRVMCSNIVKENKLGKVVDLYYIENEVNKYVKTKNRDRLPETKSIWVKDNLKWETFCERLEKVMVE